VKTIGSLFAGIGGFDLGFERAGFKTAWACEIDQKAQAVLRLRFPDAKLHDDVCAVGAHNLEPVDVVTFGSPCQDLSVAGKRAGLAGERSGLFHEAVRVIRELRAQHGKPDFAIWENVPGAFSSNGGRDFAAVIQALVDIGARDVAWRVLDSRFFGVAQRRRRVFLVADFGGERAEQVLALTEGVRGYSPKGRQARQGSASGAGYSPATSSSQEWPARISCTLNTAFGTKMGLEDQHALAGAPMFVPDVSKTVTSKWSKGSGGFAGEETNNLISFEAPRTGEFIESDVAGTMTAQSGGLGETRNPAFVLKLSTHVPPKASCLETTNHDYSRADGFTAVAFNWQEGPSGSLGVSDADTGGEPPVRVSQTLAVAHEVTDTLDGGSGQRGWCNDLDRSGAFIPESTSVVRRLTPVECCRLQGFPDDWNSEGIDAKGKRFSMADAPRYRQLGNAVTVNVANWLANNLSAVYADDKEPGP
jgi:DNA (cytosine-5)-methyltransferase 1